MTLQYNIRCSTGTGTGISILGPRVFIEYAEDVSDMRRSCDAWLRESNDVFPTLATGALPRHCN